jgi:hypothetical protein
MKGIFSILWTLRATVQTLVFLHIGRVEGNIVGCMDKAFREYDPYATVADGSACQTLHVAGCMDQFDVDYNPSATTSDPDACAGVSFHDSLVAEAQSIESMLGVKQMTSALYITEQEAREDLLEQAAAELSSLREELDAMEDQQRDELDAATAASVLEAQKDQGIQEAYLYLSKKPEGIEGTLNAMGEDVARMDKQIERWSLDSSELNKYYAEHPRMKALANDFPLPEAPPVYRDYEQAQIDSKLRI